MTGYDATVKSVAQFMVKMSAQTYSGVGSLTFNAEGDIVVGPLMSRPFKATQGAKLSVYRTSAECKIACIDHLLRLVREKCLGWDPLRRWKKGPDPIWHYVILLEMRELVNNCEEMNREQPTYLRHMDDHLGQYHFSEDGHITAVLDWE